MKNNRIIVTVLGKDKVGIIAATTRVLANANANILDISQTILSEFFTMIMIVDITGCTMEFSALKENLRKTGEEIGLQIDAQRAEVFDFMHRV
jgi:ACT domain-containing protein